MKGRVVVGRCKREKREEGILGGLCGYMVGV